MFSSYLYWFIYRRRNKFLILLMIIFCISFFLYHNDNPASSGTKNQADKPRKIRSEKKIRINRETYTTPEPCRGCPGEDGQGVQLSVIFI